MHNLKVNTINNRYIILVACLTVVCTQSGITMYSPSIPYLGQIFKVGYTCVAYTLTAYLLGYAAAVLVFGGVSDQLGRKRGYLITIIIFSLSSLLLAFTQSIYLFIGLRFLQGIGGGGCAVIARASVRDVFCGKKLVSAMSYISISFIISMGVFQFLGGIIQTHANYRLDFIFMFCFGLLVLMLVARRFKETQRQVKYVLAMNMLISDYAKILREKFLVIIALGAGIGYSMLLTFNILGVYYLRDRLNISPNTIGLIGIYFSAAYLFGSLIVNKLVRYIEIDSVIKIGKAIVLFAGTISIVSALANMHSLLFILTPILVGLFGQALIYPCAMTKALEPYRAAPGAASSLFGFMQQCSGFMVSMIVGWLPYESLFSFGVVIFLISLISFILLTNRFLHQKI